MGDAGDEHGSELAYRYDVAIAHLLASPVHRYEGRPTDGPRGLPAGTAAESRERIEVRAHLGVVGDRHFGHAAHRTASVTVMALESVEHVQRVLGLEAPLDPYATRRNILIRGIDVDLLKRARFSLDSGQGAVGFQGHRPANPCAWMNVTLAEGAHQALRGRGGVRCEPLTSGTLALGPAVLRSSIPLEQNGAVLF
ncbi:MOSC domain-containing protein [Subtercola boreus]|uniref:Molybdenum cofactor biosysynthesis protein n=1 Tax=Subtercola boreus TaxID=120213 RepID=A0A3E0WF10_9MICO|nr:MOSC domain-containing protein [Subtercola boreus]RFA23616.1 molybdenum cofactor biosysynthesis protein [Subtercola boreus]RFA24010.1 molybdenum cofactor biosysynthesis protein [Subtercola boreus]RFA29708.1 molybdenum cofactor biosysynthesis protein [Subtercola boreus]